MENAGPVISSHGLVHHGVAPTAAHWNLSSSELNALALSRGEAKASAAGALVVTTGKHTGRAPNDKFIVEEAGSRDHIWWGEVNRPINEAHFEALHTKVLDHFASREVFVQDVHAGAEPAHRLKVRVVTETAWHAAFADNMFLAPSEAERADFVPEFTVLHAPGCQASPATDGTNSEVFVVVHFARRIVLIGGTWYAGEIKKSVFSLLNYLLPEKRVLPMHCSANIGPDGEAAIFFGLSGTGKTTLSADGTRTLIGDDEHGWSDNGVFNFEGGCYAKVINLSAEQEPEIYATTQRPGTILENVVMRADGTLDLDDNALTENTRASYPIDFIPNIAASGAGGHPATVVMLTADAFGVLPPISRLSPEQAMYHFLSGYTARVAGTERGMGKEPQATFSTCFGAPFMPRHPTVYATLLGEKIARHGARCWLVNTGWSGGAYGVGERMKIHHTRAMVRAALDGRLASASTVTHPLFGLAMPEACPDVPADVLNPRNTWSDKSAYDAAAVDLTRRFENNFAQFAEHVDADVLAAGIRAAA